MPPWKYFDFECRDCGCVFESMVQGEPEEIPCEECGKPAIRHMPGVLLGQMNVPHKKREALKKRSEEHTKRQQKAGNIKSVRDVTGK